MTKKWLSKVSPDVSLAYRARVRSIATDALNRNSLRKLSLSKHVVLLAAAAIIIGPVGIGLGREDSWASSQSQEPAPARSGDKVAAPPPSQNLIAILEEVNVSVDLDPRLFAVMAALDAAGYEYPSNGQPLSSLRQSLRADLAGLDPRLRERLHAYFHSHRLVGADEPGQVARYVALSFIISPPPQFRIAVPQSSLPVDVVTVLDFVPLLREFYLSIDLSKLFNKYAKTQEPVLRQYEQETARVLFETLNYLHTRPVLAWNIRPSARSAPSEKVKKKDRSGDESVKAASVGVEKRTRSRRLHLLPNALDALNSAYIRNDIPDGTREEGDQTIGDDYLVVVGPSAQTLVTAVRVAFLRFVLEPLGSKYGREIRSRSEALRTLFKMVTKRDTGVDETAFLLVTQSLAAAAEARMKITSLPATSAEVAAEREEEALLGLSTQYQRGAVLAFHFYEKLIPWERVGVDIEGYYPEMINSISFGRESDRVAEVTALRARLEGKRAERAGRATREPVAEKLAAADDLIQRRGYREARPILEEILKAYPEHARALYGLARVLSGLASEIDPRKAPDPNLAQDQITENLLAAVKLFRQAAERAHPAAEIWVASQAHVAAGRILDFFGERAAAISEYRAAMEIGPVPGGAYQTARDGLDHPLSR